MVRQFGEALREKKESLALLFLTKWEKAIKKVLERFKK